MTPEPIEPGTCRGKVMVEENILSRRVSRNVLSLARNTSGSTNCSTRSLFHLPTELSFNVIQKTRFLVLTFVGIHA
jgi:hypothetical protein